MSGQDSRWKRLVKYEDIVAGLLEWQPMAYSIRRAGRCPECKQEAQISYLIPQDSERHRGGGFENCGYYCGYCGWGNAGGRIKL